MGFASPLTGLQAQEHQSHAEDLWMVNEPRGIGRWGTRLGHAYLRQAGYPFATTSPSTGPRNDEALRALACTTVWEAERRGGPSPLFLARSDLQWAIDRGYASGGDWLPVVIEELRREAARLTFDEKVIRTLANIALAAPQIGEGLMIAHKFAPYPGRAPERPDAHFLPILGMAYGCTRHEAPLVLMQLKEDDLIRVMPEHEAVLGTTVFITPKGYSALSKLRLGESSAARRGFCVCRFMEPVSTFVEGVIKRVSRESAVNCPIERVIDIAHIERIDDRIIAEIRSATLVVVDLTLSNFNVGFEAGYAMALAKPIIWTRRNGGRRVRLPFDIQSWPVLFWDLSDTTLFEEQFRARMQLVLEQSGSGRVIGAWGAPSP